LLLVLQSKKSMEIKRLDLKELFRNIPILRILLPLLAGIVLNFYFRFSINHLLPINLAVFALLLTFHLVRTVSSNYHFSWIFGLLLNVQFILLGLYTSDSNLKNKYNYVEWRKNRTISAYIVQTPVETDNCVKTVLQIEAIRTAGEWKAVDTKALVRFEKDEQSLGLQLGDQMMSNCSFKEIEPPGNPYQFDYKTYLAYQNIHISTYLKTDYYELTGRKKGNALLLFADRLRIKLLEIYKENGLEGEEYAVAAALTLGYKDLLDETTRRNYSSSGAMHILAVSGLHVGIIYMVLTTLLQFLDRKRLTAILRIVILILVLWLFALITGLSPSVRRAAFMFTFVIFGKILNRNATAYNALAGSALVLILLQPQIIFEVGFQLSYVAVIAILALQKLIAGMWTPRNIVLSKAWDLIAVSVAAQIGTFPIGLYYFHQFPTYFIITNLIVIPLATWIVVGCLILLAVSFVPTLSTIVAFGLKYLLIALNLSVSFIESLPLSTFQHIAFSISEVFIVYALILFITMFLTYKYLRLLYLAVSMLLLFILTNTIHHYKTLDQQTFICYNINGHSAYNLISGKSNVLFITDQLKNEFDKVEFAAQNYWTQKGVNQPEIIDLHVLDTTENQISLPPTLLFKNNFIRFADTDIFILRNDSYYKYKKSKKLSIDYLIVANNVKIDYKRLLSHFEFKMLIIDSSNSKGYKNTWIYESIKHNKPSYSVVDQGAFIVTEP